MQRQIQDFIFDFTFFGLTNDIAEILHNVLHHCGGLGIDYPLSATWPKKRLKGRSHEKSALSFLKFRVFLLLFLKSYIRLIISTVKFRKMRFSANS